MNRLDLLVMTVMWVALIVGTYWLGELLTAILS